MGVRGGGRLSAGSGQVQDQRSGQGQRRMRPWAGQRTGTHLSAVASQRPRLANLKACPARWPSVTCTTTL